MSRAGPMPDAPDRRRGGPQPAPGRQTGQTGGACDREPWAGRLGGAAVLLAGHLAPPPAHAQRVDRDRELRPLYDPNLGMDESGRIPKVACSRGNISASG